MVTLSEKKCVHDAHLIKGNTDPCIMHAMVDSMPTPGADIADSLGILLRRSSRAHLYTQLTAGLDDALDEATYPVISGLDRYGPRSAAQLATDIGLDRSVVSRHASRLAAAGLIERLPDPADRRATLLTLTGTGRRAVGQMRGRLAGVLDEYLARWEPGEAERFAASLRRFIDESPF
jgi:DNA-binding MarR family transcriptional regulator